MRCTFHQFLEQWRGKGLTPTTDLFYVELKPSNGVSARIEISPMWPPNEGPIETKTFDVFEDHITEVGE